MKNLFNFFSIVLFIVGFTSCGGNDDSAVSRDRSMEDVIEDFKNLTITPGINDLIMESTFKGVYWKFRLIVPAEATVNNKRPLIVTLHGGATLIETELYKSTGCLTEPGFEDLNPIILSPSSDGFIWYDIPNQSKVLTLTELVKTQLPVDKDKVVITGYSDGGNGSWYYAQYYPEAFSASIAMASSYNPVRPVVSVKIDIPIYVIHGSEDQLFPLASTVNYVNTTAEAGSNIEFVIAEGLEHYNSCIYVSYLKDAANWLESTVWK